MNIRQTLRDHIFLRSFLRRKHIRSWIAGGYSLPLPAELKQEAVLYHAIDRHLDILVETGTFLGEMIAAQEPYFRKIYSIELSEELFDRAKKKFAASDNIHLIHGDSAVRLRQVIDILDSPAIFWLDGHYSGGITARGETDCPIYSELEHVFASPFDNTVLIDDARLFNGTHDYPTLEELSSFVTGHSKYQMRVENDMVVLTPRSTY